MAALKLSLLLYAGPMSSCNLPPNVTTNDNSLAGNLFLATVAAVLLSFAGFQGWLKLFLIGAIFETCRRVDAWGSIIGSFWITVEIREEDDRSHDMMLLWLSRHPTLEKEKMFSIRDSAPGLKSFAYNIGNQGNGQKAHFLLAYNHVYTFWHKWRYIKATRSLWGKDYIRVGWREYKERRNQTLNFSILGGGRWIVDDLLTEAKECCKRAREERISIFVPARGNRWRPIASHPKRLLDSIILDSGVKEDILHDARDFLDSQEWYSERGIPFRRGYLLHGSPGSGKTSLIQGIAGELNLDVFIISFSRTRLDDDGLRELMSRLPERCVALMEDIDVAFHHTSNRELLDEGRALEGIKGLERDRSGKVSLRGFLNALDGVGAKEGRLLFATTNRLEALDAALRRPGRIDYVIEFKLASQYQAGELFKKFYLPNRRTSTSQRSPYKDPATSKDEDGNRMTLNPGYTTPVEPEAEKLVDVESPMGVQNQSLTAFARRRKHDVELSPEQLDVLVERFRESIPERESSMAALQGYLLMHKSQPHRAVECARRWVEEEMAKRGSGSFSGT